jgi:hypothetical protein
MVWRHYEARQSGDCELQHDQETLSARYSIGIVETGRSRVFAGHLVRLTLTGGEQIGGEDGHSLRGALWRLARNITALGFTLNCVGLDAEFSESGLSVDTGWGYWGRQSKPMHMMDEPPNGRERPVDQMIREAVEGMRIGLDPYASTGTSSARARNAS